MINKQETGLDLSEVFGVKASGLVNHATLGYTLSHLFFGAAHTTSPAPTIAPAAPGSQP